MSEAQRSKPTQQNALNNNGGTSTEPDHQDYCTVIHHGRQQHRPPLQHLPILTREAKLNPLPPPIRRKILLPQPHLPMHNLVLHDTLPTPPPPPTPKTLPNSSFPASNSTLPKLPSKPKSMTKNSSNQVYDRVAGD
ncbi:hypothetical protein BST61_g9440 [Cercospora zeina]